MDVYICYTPGRMEAVSVLGKKKKYQLEALLYPEQYAGPDQIAASVSVMKFTWTASGTCMSTRGERI